MTDRAQMTSGAMNDLPDSAFAYIEPGGKKDASGRTVPRSLRHFPIHDAAHVRNALARAPQSPFGDKAMPKIKAAAKRLGVHVGAAQGRADVDEMPGRPCDRAFVVEDLHVRSDGGGRVVEAYAAAFDVQTEIMDQDGHYHELLPPTSFNRAIDTKGPTGFRVLFNHGRTIDGEPNPLATMPIGVPLEVKADPRGVFTATRYLDNPLADHVLDAIKQGAIKAQSFSGRFTKSSRSWPDGRGSLPLITRHVVDMREYGPAVFAAYDGAAILGTRAEQFVRTLLATPPDQRLSWLEQFEGLTTPSADLEALPVGTPDGPAGVADDLREHSARPMSLRAQIRRARIIRGIPRSD